MGKYDDIDFTPPQKVRENAKRGLALRREFGRGGTDVGVARARTLSNGQAISPDTVGRMVSFFARHAGDKRPDWASPNNPTNGYIAWLLWGGDAGQAWANKLQRQMQARDKSIMPLRKALLISTNNRIDRDGEIVSTQALTDYVDRCHNEQGDYIGNSDVLIWHKGDPIGRVIDCGLINGFLVEIVTELDDAPVNIGTPDDPHMTTIKACWDAIQKAQDTLGVSQGFFYSPNTQDDDGVFYRIIKYESSILPIESASNPYTFVRVFGSNGLPIME